MAGVGAGAGQEANRSLQDNKDPPAKRAARALATTPESSSGPREQDPEEGVGAGVDTENETNKKKNEGMNNLSQAKDRAQLSSASAMSILNISVLGEVIKDGSGGSFYYPLLAMVSLALFLQIVVGVLCLKISHLRNSFKKFKSGPRRRKRDCIKSCCCFCCRTKTAEDGGGAVGRRDLRNNLEGAFNYGFEDINAGIAEMRSLPERVMRPEGLEREQASAKVPTLSQIYGNASTSLSPQEPDYARVPAPYELQTSGGRKPKTFENKSIARLSAWFDHMLETKERHIEARENVKFLEREAAECTSKLDGLDRDLEQLNKAEAVLCEEMDEVAGRLGLLGSEQEDRLRGYGEEKQAVLEQLALLDSSFPPADDASGQRLKLQQGLEDVQRRIDFSKARALDYRRAAHRRDDVENRMRLHFEAKKETTSDIRQAEVYLRAIKEEQERQKKQKRLLKINSEKLKLYQTTVDDLEEKKVLKRVMFWQSVINYILYFVFVLNLFITAFTLSSDKDE